MQISAQSYESIVHTIELGILGLIGYYIRRIARIVNVLNDYPPHYHARGGDILYPRDFKPPEVRKLNGEAKP